MKRARRSARWALSAMVLAAFMAPFGSAPALAASHTTPARRAASLLGVTGASGTTRVDSHSSTSSLSTLASGTLGAIADPLTANGFSSPSCSTAALFAQLAPSERRDCDVSGVAVAPVPLANYGLDTNIASGLDASFDDDLDSIIQGLLVTPVWTALVWLVHVVIVALEWCYSIDLLAPAMLGAVTKALGSAEQIFTQPWLGLALALAGIACAWNGLVRRRVATTLAQAGLMLAMMSVGLWIIANPAGTVGAVSGLADQAALGTVAATATGDVSQPAADLDDALGEVFDTAVTGPWCYLEFGDVDWCMDPAQLDPRLATTAHKLEQLYSAGATCHGPAPGLVQCVPAGSAQQRTYAGIALALSAARTNGALFLALPAGGLARNELSSETPLPTLYGTLCGSSDTTACTAGTAPQAEFRTAEGTWPRAGGLLLIAIGIFGMLALLTFISLRLLGAALALLVYLLLAPLAVLAPAFGDGGRDTFRVWLVRLVGAALAKLVYSVMLGVTLLVAHLLTTVEVLGWWTQWLLFAVFWWLAFEHRHRMLSFVVHERSEPTSRLALATRMRYGAQAFGSARRTAVAAGRASTRGVLRGFGAWQQIHNYPGESAAAEPPATAIPPRRRLRAGLAAQVGRSLAVERAAPTQVPAVREEIARLTARRTLLTREALLASGAGDARRATSLTLRARAVEVDLAARRGELRDATSRLPRRIALAASSRGRARLLDRAALTNRAGGRLPARDYARLAGLAGLSPRRYERASAEERLRARAEIERQLAQRRRWLLDAGATPARPSSRAEALRHRPALLGRRERQFASRLR